MCALLGTLQRLATCLWTLMFTAKCTEVYFQDGDFLIGGLIPLHLYDESSQACGEIRELGSLRRVEALAHTVNVINRDDTILPNITLGYEIYDTCSNIKETLRKTLNFMPQTKVCPWTNDTRSYDQGRGRPSQSELLGVVGAQRSSSSIQAATFLGIYEISMVSFLSTSDELSQTKRYPYFFRTVPPDRFQINAMLDIIDFYDWKYVVFLNSEGSYGTNAQIEFTNAAKERDVCVAYTRTISFLADDLSYKDLIQELLALQKDSLLSVVILFAQNEIARKIFCEANQQKAWRKFIWIGSDGWGNYGLDTVKDVEEVALGAFTVLPKSGSSMDFENHFRSLSLNSSTNPWLREFINFHGACGQLHPGNDCPTAYLASPSVPSHETLVVDSVQVFARALDKLWRDKCLTFSNCEDMRALDREELKDYLLNVSFISPNNGQIKFFPNGDSRGRYNLRNLQYIDGEYRFVDVGSWKDVNEGDRLELFGNIPWYVERDSNFTRPRSVCSNSCKKVEITVIRNDQPCCWECVFCKEDQIIVNGTNCELCYDPVNQIYKWPDPTKQACIEIKRITVLEQPGLLVLLTCAVIGLLTTVSVTVVYIWNGEKALIKASSRELSYIILVGISGSYATTLLFGTNASFLVCIARGVLPAFTTSLIYVPLGVMTVRLFRIFQRGKKTAKRPKFISPTSQVLASLQITLIPLIWCSFWVIFDPPIVKTLPPSDQQLYIQQVCQLNFIQDIGQLAWNLIIVFTCCYFAFRTRNLPANYNQTRFIAFSVFTSLIVYIACAPVLFTRSQDDQRDLYSALALVVQATIILICIFIVKLYALLFVNEEKLNAMSVTEHTEPNTPQAPANDPS